MTPEQWQGKFAEQRAAVRLLIDENLPQSLKFHLSDLFPGSIHVSDIELTNSPDLAIWEYAKAFRFAIMTKDSDFAVRAREQGPPPTVIQLRFGNCSVSKMVFWIRQNASQIVTAVQFGGALLEVTQSQAASGADPRE